MQQWTEEKKAESTILDEKNGNFDNPENSNLLYISIDLRFYVVNKCVQTRIQLSTKRI